MQDFEIPFIDLNAATLARGIVWDGSLMNFETSVSKILISVEIIKRFIDLGHFAWYCKVSKCKFYL